MEPNHVGFASAETRAAKKRFAVAFTSVGWQVVDTLVARDPVGEFGLGAAEYAHAAEFAWHLNRDAEQAAERYGGSA